MKNVDPTNAVLTIARDEFDVAPRTTVIEPAAAPRQLGHGGGLIGHASQNPACI